MRRVSALFLTSIALCFLHGCGSDCARLKKDHTAAIESANPFVELPEADEIHFAITVKDALLDKIANKVLQSGIQKAMTLSTGIKVGSGQSVKVNTLPNITNVSVRADAACDHCVKLMGKVDGKVDVTVPIIGKQTVPLAGDLAIVAPLLFSTGKTKDAAIKVDLAQAAKMGKSTLTTNIRQLPPTWSNALSSPLAKSMLDSVLTKLKPVTLFEFDAPDFGIEGLKVRPTKIVTDAKNHTIFIGLASNLAGTPGQTIAPYTKLSSTKNVAFGIHPAAVSSIANALMKTKKISRTYDENGNDAAGPFAVLMQGVEAKPKDGGAGMTTKFRLWNLPSSGKCYWADVDATSTMAVKDGKFSIDVSTFDVTDSSLPGFVLQLSKWVNSKFWDSQRRVVVQGLSDEGFDLPGEMKLNAAPRSIAVIGNGLWLSSSATIK